MKLEKVLDLLNSLEKNAFVKILENIANKPKYSEEFNQILIEKENVNIKNLDNVIISKIFNLIEDEYINLIREEFLNTSSQLDILIDIIIRDGNCIMKQDWFNRLYEAEIEKIGKKINNLKKELDDPKSEIPENKKRDYDIYKSCVSVAYFNDEVNNKEKHITNDEQSILVILAQELGLSQEEVKLINHLILGTEKTPIETIVTDLRNIGVLFYSKKMNTIFIPDEIVRMLRRIRRKEIADKFLRRFLRLLKESHINLICRKYNLEYRNLTFDEKIKNIIAEGISFTNLLKFDLYKEGTALLDKKKFLNDFWQKSLNMPKSLKGVTLEDKIANIISYFEAIEQDDKVTISIDAYEKLLQDLNENLPKLNEKVKNIFEIENDDVLNHELLLNLNIKPRDILNIIETKNIKKFCENNNISTRGNEIENILEAYKDTGNLYLENYVNIAYRDYNTLKSNGIHLKEADIGIKFEELTKNIFEQLGFTVAEDLRKRFNTKKDKMDILLDLGDQNLILIECKTVKESGYNKFSSVSRQMKAYADVITKENYHVIKSLLVAPDFSDEFIQDTELEYNLNLSLIKAESLIKILEGFKVSTMHKQFPFNLLMRDVLIQEDRILKSISR